MKQLFTKFMNRAFEDNESFIRDQIDDFRPKKKKLLALDVGCGDGEMTQRLFRNSIDRYQIHGLDAFAPSKDKNIVFSKINLEKDKFPFKDNTFDLVLSNQVIEHLLNKDDYLAEIHRVLRPSGLAIISTENIASFDNILSLMLGQEPITQHTGNYYKTNSILASGYMQKMESQYGNLYGHKNVCSYFGLKRLAELAGYKNIKIKGFGNVARFLESVLPIYNRVITLTGTK